MATRFYLETDFNTGEGVRVYRSKNYEVMFWNGSTKEWRHSVRSQPELDGLGGYAPFTLIFPSQAAAWQKYFAGEGPDPSKPRKRNWDSIANADPTNAEARRRLSRRGRRR